MNKVVIIGAGPIGLYLAIKLKKAGVKDLVIYDPRAEEYTRPGHLSPKIHKYLQTKLELPLDHFTWKNKEFNLLNKVHHIKDIERLLFVEAKKLNITIEKKQFTRFNEDSKKNGIIVLNKDKQEELIECNYAFDCTGSKRVLIHQVNEKVKDHPFTIQPLQTKPPVKNYFLAYVKMKEADLDRINEGGDKTSTHMLRVPSLHYAQALEKLREFGWKKFGFPFCYGETFGKDKVCLYLECPDNLPVESFEKWVQTVINSNTMSHDIKFEQLPPSKKGIVKPHFHSFIVDPKELKQAEYNSKELPVVIAMGDAQIDPHFYLAHGIKDALDRVDLFINHIAVYNGNITFYDSSQYLSCIQSMLSHHKDNILNYYEQRSDFFNTMISVSKIHYEQAIKQSSNDLKTQRFKATLIEIEALLNYQKGLHELTDFNKHLSKKDLDISDLKNMAVQLTKANTLLLYALKNLPKSYCREENSQEKLVVLANGWKELGSLYFASGQIEMALQHYQSTMLTLKNGNLLGQHHLLELNTISNSIVCYKKLNQTNEAIRLGKEALENYSSDLSMQPFKRKIVFHLVKIYSDLIHKALATEDKNNASVMSKNILELFSKNKSVFASVEGSKVLKELNKDIELFRSLNQSQSSFEFFNAQAQPIVSHQENKTQYSSINV